MNSRAVNLRHAVKAPLTNRTIHLLKHQIDTATSHLLSADLPPCLHRQPLGAPPLTPGLNTYTIDSLRRSFNPISATNLFPDETPDTDRASSTTEPAHFSDIDEDDPSPYDDEPPSIDDDVPVIRITTDTGGVDAEDTAPAPHTDMIIGDTNNPNGMDDTTLMGPRDDTHVVNSNTAASPIFEDAQAGASITAHSTAIPTNDIIVNSDIAASPTLEETIAPAVDAGSHDDTRIIDSGTTASPTLKRKRNILRPEPDNDDDDGTTMGGT